MVALIQLLALAAIALALYLVLLLLRTRPTTYSPRRSFWWQLNHAWIERRSALREPDRPFRGDVRMDELISLCNGDRNTARRLADGAGSADRAIAQLLRDRR
jgi:hypothetical protein